MTFTQNIEKFGKTGQKIKTSMSKYILDEREPSSIDDEENIIYSKK